MKRHPLQRPYGSATPLAMAALLITLAPAAARADSAATHTTRLTLSPSALRLGASGPRLEGFRSSTAPGQPALPERSLRVALHPRVNLASLRITLRRGPVDTLAGVHRLRPNPPYRFTVRGQRIQSWGRAEVVVAGKDLEAYSRAVFPSLELERQRVDDYRGMKLLTLRYRPLRYRDSGAELLLTRHLEATLSYRLKPPTAALPAVFPPDPQLDKAIDTVVNREQARSFYGRADTAQAPGYAIIIPQVLRDKSKRLADFVAHKKKLGFEVTLVSETDLAQAKVPEGASEPLRLRTWLQERYKALNLAYALIIGNPTSSKVGAPMMMVHTVENVTPINEITPTDHYFADLTGDWDKNGDGKVAKYPVDGGDGGIDFLPEILVGRIPVYDDNAATLDAILKKTILYETEAGDRKWRRRVLQPAALLFLENQYGQSKYDRQDGADQADAVFDQVVKPAGWEHTALYEREGQDPSKLQSDGALDTDTVVSEWQRGYGLVNLYGHGSPHGIYRLIWNEDDGNKVPDWKELSEPSFLSYNDIMRLSDQRPAVVFHMSCSNGTPERPDNLAYGLLRHGAIATAAASRVAIVPDIASGPLAIGMARDFTKGLIAGKTTGEALFAAKEEILAFPGQIGWYTMLQYNLYGDPSVRVTACATDAHCDDGKVCNGAERCDNGLCKAGTPVDCKAADSCTEAVCEEPSGSCKKTPRPDGELCDDGLFCTVGETCQAGVCKGEPRCAAPGNPCVTGNCDEVTKSCDVEKLSLEGQTCRPGTDREGVCKVGLCEPTDDGCTIGGSNTGLTPLGLTLALLLGLALWRRRR